MYFVTSLGDIGVVACAGWVWMGCYAGVALLVGIQQGSSGVACSMWWLWFGLLWLMRDGALSCSVLLLGLGLLLVVFSYCSVTAVGYSDHPLIFAVEWLVFDRCGVYVGLAGLLILVLYEVVWRTYSGCVWWWDTTY